MVQSVNLDTPIHFHLSCTLYWTQPPEVEGLTLLHTLLCKMILLGEEFYFIYYFTFIMVCYKL